MNPYERGRFAEVQNKLEAVASNLDVARIVHQMVADLEAHPRAWENTTLESFLHALTRCIEAQPQLYANLRQDYPATASWRQFAEALVAASGYE